jgi:transposase
MRADGLTQPSSRGTCGFRWDEKAGPPGRDAVKLPMERRTRSAKGEPAMKKNSISPKGAKQARQSWKGPITVGMDIGDRTSRYCILDGNGEMVGEGSAGTTKAAMTQLYGQFRKCRIALEVGTHSPWLSRLLKAMGHEVIVANPRQLRLITESSRKDDRVDAQMLARLARVDAKLLRPIRHRGEEAQMDLMVIRARASLVEARTSLINAVRGFTKATGDRLASCDADQMGVEKAAELPAGLQDVLRPLLEQVEVLTAAIRQYDRKIEQIAKVKYPETTLLKQVGGVGTLIALTFVLTVEDKDRFEHSRDVGCYVGLRPKRSQSGESEPQLRITKEGDIYLRKLLVQGAQHITSDRSRDSDLKRWGLRLAERGGKNAKKRAIVAVARKLGILLHRLWVTGEVYEPLRNSDAQSRKAA